MSLGRALVPDHPGALDGVRERLPLMLGIVVLLVELAFWGRTSRTQADAAPALRPGMALYAAADWPRPSVSLRPPYDLEREASPFILSARSPAERRRALRCLANAVYYEAALEPLDGQRAVAQVVLNRVRDVDFPHSICGVVYQGWARRSGCQFTFTCNGALDRAPMATVYAQARDVAEAALNGYVMAGVGTATHYHTADIDPWWRPALVRVAQVGAHVFYGWRRAPSELAASRQRYGGGELKLPQTVIDGHVPNLTETFAARPASTTIGVSDPAGPGMAEIRTGRIERR